MSEDVDSALATHMMLDPKIQERLFVTLTQALNSGYTREEFGAGGVRSVKAPVDAFVNALFAHPFFRHHLDTAISEAFLQRLDARDFPGYTSEYNPP
jgi:hypothetical protein